MTIAFRLEKKPDHIVCSFGAMASPCEFLFETDDLHLAKTLARVGTAEIARIQSKFSRYVCGNLCDQLNHSDGKAVAIDEECYRLLVFADDCYHLSEGLFDITSGAFRHIWSFSPGATPPSVEHIEDIKPLVDWRKVRFSKTHFSMPEGMALDFGGIGKEYAVSRVSQLFRSHEAQVSSLINLGGDLQITGKRRDKTPWRVGIAALNKANESSEMIPIYEGALATSGDTERFIIYNGVRYSHVIHPKTGWPVAKAPASITVAGSECVQAGCLATIALLQGENAATFLESQGVGFWCQYR